MCGKLEKLIITNSIKVRGTSEIIQIIEDILAPSKSKFGFEFDVCYAEEDSFSILWRQAEQIFMTILIFISENGPL